MIELDLYTKVDETRPLVIHKTRQHRYVDKKVMSHLANTRSHAGYSGINVNLKLQMCSLGPIHL